jgi:predicted dehydrogenase
MGTGARGRALASQFSKLPGCHIGYVCDVDERAVGAGVTAVDRRLAERPKTVTDVRRILDDKQIDALVIAAPDHWHAPAAILACAAGKHVYVEKPASHNGHEGMLLIEAARKHKRHVQMGNQRRSSEKIAEAIGLLKEGEIGKVLFARGWITSTRKNIGHGKETPVPAGFDYTLWQGPAPDAPFRDNVHPYQWHWFWNWGTGELGNNGIHAIDLCRWGMGVDYPTHVTCAGGKYYFDDDQETPDTQIATFHFGERAINWEHRTWHKRGFEGHSFGVTFYGSRGTLLLVGNNYTFYDSDGKKTKQTVVDRGDKYHLVNFLDAVRSDTKLNSEIEEGVKSTTLCHLGNIAYRVGQTVKFDPEKKTIVGSTQAAALWKRQYRSGWEPAV